jgi:microcin C transport system permease protein
MFLPVACYMVGEFATLTILTKNSLMENMSQDYVRTAFAKGLHKRRVIFVHALRNSLIPIATGLGHAFSLILAGSFLIEKVFNIDGMGYLGYTSILQRDYPVALGILVIGSLLLLLGNIISDMIYAFVDPRIRFK